MPSPMNYSVKIIILNREDTPDGLGGIKTTWSERCIVDAYMSMGDMNRSGSTAGVSAEQQTTFDNYTVMVAKAVDISFGDYFKNGENVFRVTSTPREIPNIATFQVKAFNAENTEVT